MKQWENRLCILLLTLNACKAYNLWMRFEFDDATAVLYVTHRSKIELTPLYLSNLIFCCPPSNVLSFIFSFILFVGKAPRCTWYFSISGKRVALTSTVLAFTMASLVGANTVWLVVVTFNWSNNFALIRSCRNEDKLYFCSVSSKSISVFTGSFTSLVSSSSSTCSRKEWHVEVTSKENKTMQTFVFIFLINAVCLHSFFSTPAWTTQSEWHWGWVVFIDILHFYAIRHVIWLCTNQWMAIFIIAIHGIASASTARARDGTTENIHTESYLSEKSVRCFFDCVCKCVCKWRHRVKYTEGYLSEKSVRCFCDYCVCKWRVQMECTCVPPCS